MDADIIEWPKSSIDSAEVEFVGKVAQACFGADFKKLAVSWSETWVEGKLALSIANVQLHLERAEAVNFLAPLARLQAMLARDQTLFQCQIFRLERSNDNASMHVTCARVSVNTCWDVLKSGFCPRTSCTWEHPAPTVMNVSLAGGPPMAMQTPLASLMPKPVVESLSETIPSKEFHMVPPSNAAMNEQMCFNFGAFDDMTDSSEEM